MIGLPGGDDFDTNHNGVHHWGWAEIVSNKEEDWNENFTGNSRMSLLKEQHSLSRSPFYVRWIPMVLFETNMFMRIEWQIIHLGLG